MNKNVSKIYIASDHRGVGLKLYLIEMLAADGYQVVNLGTDDPNTPVDFPDIAANVATAMENDKKSRGILICGTGIGIGIAASKVKGTRVCTCSDVYSAELSKRHNNSNILTMGARVVGVDLAKMIATHWLTAEFEGGRHQRRIDMITAIENGAEL